MAKKTVKEEEVKIPSKKTIVKEDMVISLDENKNIIKTPIQVIVKEKTVDEEIEQKIVNNSTKMKKVESIDFELDNSISDSFMEIEAEVMKDEDDDIFTENENKNIIDEIKPIINNELQSNETNIISIFGDINEEKIEQQEVIKNKNIKTTTDDELLQDKPSTPLQEEVLTEVFHYNASEKVKLIQDRPSVPLQAEGLTGKKLYESYLGKKYIMYYNGELFYDSEKSTYSPVFHNDFFELYSIRYSYRGLRIKIKE
jgi:hypothetical protein